MCTGWKFRRRQARGSNLLASLFSFLLKPNCNLLVCREADDLLRQLQEEQRKTISLTQEMSTSSSSRSVFLWETVWDYVLIAHRQSLHQAKEKIRDLEKDNVILRCILIELIYLNGSLCEGKATRNFSILPLTWRENENTWYGIKTTKKW